MATQSKFDFETYNTVMRSANSGLRLHLAIQLMSDVEQTYRRFNSPFAKEVIDLVDELKDLQKRNRDYLAKRENSGNTEKIDSQSDLYNTSTSADAGKVS